MTGRVYEVNAAMVAALGVTDFDDPDRPVLTVTLDLVPGTWPTLTVTRAQFGDAGSVAEVVERFKLKPSEATA